MAINFKTFFAGIKIKAKAILTSDSLGDIETSSVTNRTYLHDGTVNSPIVTEVSSGTLENKNLVDDTTFIVDATDPTTKLKFDVAGTTGSNLVITTANTTNRNVTIPDGNGEFLLSASTQTVTNKTINAPDNDITNLTNTSIATGANIALNKLEALSINQAAITDSSGVITTSSTTATEIGFVQGVTSSIQTQLDDKISISGPSSVIDANFSIKDNIDNTKVFKFDATLIAPGTPRTVTIPDADTVMVGTDTTQTLTNKTLTSPVIATPIGILSSDVGLGNVDNTSDATKNSATVTLTNKKLSDSTTSIVDSTDATKRILFDVQGSTGVSTTIISAPTFDRVITLPNSSTTLVGDQSVQTLSNKTLDDTSVNFTDTTDPTIKVKIDAAGTTGTSTTLLSSQTANRVLTLPNATDTLVGKATTDTLTNKTLTSPVINTPTGITKTDVGLSNVDNTSDATKNSASVTLTNKALSDSTTSIVDSVDATKKILFDAAGTTGTTTTLLSSQTTSKILTLPDATDTLVGKATTDTLTNKSISGATNTITAIPAGTALSGQVPVANGGTGASTASTGFNALSPMTTVGDVIIGGASGAGTRLGVGTTGQVLTVVAGSPAWAASSGGSGGSGVGSVDILMADQADSSVLADYTQTNLEIVTSPVLHGTKSFRLQHATSIKSFKKIIAVDKKFRGKNNTLTLDVLSSATSGNLNILITDETNATTLAASQPIATNSQSITATTANTSTSLVAADVTNFNLLKVGQIVTGSAIPIGTTITALTSSTLTATLSAAATGVSTGIRISDLVAKKTFSFDIPNNCASISFTISSVVEASAESYIDDIVIALTATALSSTSISQTIYNATDWIAYTPTFTGFGTPTAVEFEYRQNGQNYDIRGKFASGTSTATEARVSLPLSATSAGTAIIPSIQLAGYGNLSAATASQYNVLIEPSVGYVTFGIQASASSGQTKVQASSVISSGQILSFFASVPIAGLTTSTTTSTTIPLTTAQLVQTPDSAIQVSVANGFGSTDTLSRRFTTISSNIGDAFSYIDSVAFGAQLTALRSGDITLTFTDSGTVATDVFLYIDGVKKATSTSGGANYRATAVWTGYINAGSTVTFRRDGANVGSIPSETNFTASFAGSLKQLNVSSDAKITIPTHSLRFEGASTRGSTDTAIVKFDTQAITQGDAWSVVNTTANGTVITIKKAGQLAISGTLYFASAAILTITKNLTSLTTTVPTVAAEILAGDGIQGTSEYGSASWTGAVNVGDIIRITANANPLTQAANNLQLSLTENSIPANFSNVLPQWSQSDSSVRLNTANGYGSTNTMIRRFTNTVDNLGSAITYTDSATLGASFTVNEDGNYSIMFTDQFSTAAYLGISKNSSQLTTNIFTITAADRLSIATTSAANNSTVASWSGFLSKNDVIRPHGDATTIGNDASRVSFTISKVGKPNLTSVDVTPFVNMKTTDVEAIEALTATSTFGSTNTGVPVLNITRNTNLGVIQVISDSINGTSFKALKDCIINVSVAVGNSGTPAGFYLTRNSTALGLAAPNGIFSRVINQNATAGYTIELSGTVKLNANDILRTQRDSAAGTVFDNFTLTATADNNATASPTQQVSSDTMSFAFKATAIAATDPIGTFNTYTYATSTNTPTISATAPTQTTASMNTNGVQLFARAFNATSTSASPARVDIFIGTGLKSAEVYAYASAAKVNALFYNMHLSDGSFASYYGTDVAYDETKGILIIQAGVNGGSVTNRQLGSDVTGGVFNNGYFVFNASKSPSLVTVPNLQQRIAYLSDVKATNLPAGPAAATTTQTRLLNTIVDSTGIVTSLNTSTGSFVLPAGTYNIEAFAPAYQVGTHKARLRNTTDGITSIIGSSEYSPASSSITQSKVSGEVTITSTKTFELQHYTAGLKATDGLGTAVNSGENEVYAQVKITRIK